MRSSRFIAVVASAMLALSTVTARGEGAAVPPQHTGHFNATAFWVIFGCAGSIIFTAYLKHVTQNRQLTLLEAQTCGLAYWLRIQPPR